MLLKKEIKQNNLQKTLRLSKNFRNNFTLLEFFTPAVDLSLESEWQQISSGLQDLSQYSGRSQQSGWSRLVL